MTLRLGSAKGGDVDANHALQVVIVAGINDEVADPGVVARREIDIARGDLIGRDRSGVAGRKLLVRQRFDDNPLPAADGAEFCLADRRGPKSFRRILSYRLDRRYGAAGRRILRQRGAWGPEDDQASQPASRTSLRLPLPSALIT